MQNPVEDVVGVLWMIFQPLLFGLIAAEVEVGKLQADTVGQYSVCLISLPEFLCTFLKIFFLEQSSEGSITDN